eukprot:gene21280-15765_t
MYVTMSNSVVKFDVHGRRTVLMGGGNDGGEGGGGGGGGEMPASLAEEYAYGNSSSLPLRSAMAMTALACPAGIVGDGYGGLFVTDGCFHQIYFADESLGEATVIAGYQQTSGYAYDGELSYEAYLSGPLGIALHLDTVYFVEGYRCLVRTVSRYGGPLRTIAGSYSCGSFDAIVATGTVNLNPLQPLPYPAGVWVHQNGDVFVTAPQSHVVFRLDATDQLLDVYVGNGFAYHSHDVPINGSFLHSPAGICGVDGEEDSLYLLSMD